jgi:hypothetical protein
MNYPPTPQRKTCDCSDPCISTDDVYYAGPNLPNSGINTYNVLTSVIEKLDAIYAVPTLQRVTEMGNYTTLPIIADSFVKIGGTSSEILAANGDLITAGTNITISGGIISSTGGGGDSPITIVNTNSLFSTGLTGTGTGATGAYDSIFFGTDAGENATEAFESNFLGPFAGSLATNAYNSNFFGYSAGEGAANAYRSNFFGSGAGLLAVNASYSNFFGTNAGYQVTGTEGEEFRSNFFGFDAGNGATNANDSNFFGNSAGYLATYANTSNFFGNQAGREATNAENSNFFGYKTGSSFTDNNIGSNNIIIGTNISLPDATANAINLGGVLFSTGTHSDTTGDPSITPISGGKIGIGIVNPTNTLHIYSEAANTSGLRLERLTSTSPTSTGQAIGVDASGNVVTVTGSGGTQTLAETLVLGNNTGGTDILLNNEDRLLLENNSYLTKGTYDFGANGGISKVCGAGYEDMWQAGFRHVFDANGFIRNSTNCFNLVPDIGADVTRRYKIGSIWTLDDLTNYICTDATEGAAVWELYKEIPTIQPVSATETGVVNNTSLQELGGVDKTINGVRVGRGNISDPASENTAVGYQALQSVIHTTGDEGYYNTAFGDEALKSLTTGNSSSAFGDWALRLCTTGTYNSAIGGGTLMNLTTGSYNLAVGENSLLSNVSGQRNTAVGSFALNLNTGSYNTAIGMLAGGLSTSSGNWNILVGMQAGRDISTGSNNLLIENITNASITSGSFNIVLNPKQKSGVTTGSFNTIIGCWDGAFPNAMVNNVIIGDGQGNIRFRTTETGLTTVPGQTNALIEADTTGKAVVTKEYISGVVKPYKVYTALLTRSGATAPSPTVLENTIGTITCSYDQLGIYHINSSGLFTLNKTMVFVGNNSFGLFGNTLGASRMDNNRVVIVQTTTSGTNDEDWIEPVSIEIRVYN